MIVVHLQALSFPAKPRPPNLQSSPSWKPSAGQKQHHPRPGRDGDLNLRHLPTTPGSGFSTRSGASSRPSAPPAPPKEPEFGLLTSFALRQRRGVNHARGPGFQHLFGDRAREPRLQTASEDFGDIPGTGNIPYTYWGHRRDGPRRLTVPRVHGRPGAEDHPSQHSLVCSCPSSSRPYRPAPKLSSPQPRHNDADGP